ncbi:TatD family hydrolase, partial [Isoptericola sp. QY 916]|nr:TatD family hydrolase [Isoptericola sp. QY 916]
MARKRERGFPAEPAPLPVAVADNHTHLDAIAGVLPDDVPAPGVGEHLARAAAAGVDRVVQVGCDLPGIDWTVDLLAAGHPGVLAAVAIHPNEAVLHAGVREV